MNVKKAKNKKLVEARQLLGMTQVEVAKKSFVTARNYQKYENEGQTPNAKAAIRIAKVLASTVENLFGDDAPM